jgi:hypothetical protein
MNQIVTVRRRPNLPYSYQAARVHADRPVRPIILRNKCQKAKEAAAKCPPSTN